MGYPMAPGPISPGPISSYLIGKLVKKFNTEKY